MGSRSGANASRSWVVVVEFIVFLLPDVQHWLMGEGGGVKLRG